MSGGTGSAADRAARLRSLHRPGDPLVLPNVWDAASARIVEAAGFPVVATGSAAIAAALGYPDHEGAPAEEMLAAVGRVVAAVSVPVTADLERGYGLPATELVNRLAATGAVGCNLEDSEPRTGELVEASRQADFITAVRAAATDAGVDIVINARIDTYLHGSGTPAARLSESVRRARLYLSAGADCVYPITLADTDAIAALVAAAGGMVNVLLRPGPPTLAELAALGLARVSFGSGLHKAASAYLANMVAAIRAGHSPYEPQEPY